MVTTAVVAECDVKPVGPYRLPPAGRDGLLRRRDGAFWRLLHDRDERPVVVRAWPTGGALRFRAEAFDAEAAEWGIQRMRFAFGIDHSLAEFHRAFKRDPLIGPMIRRTPWVRPLRRPEPFEALAWAITEQLIEAERAEDIQRRLVWRWGRRGDHGLRDAPLPAVLAARAPAELCAVDLAPRRAQAMVEASRAVAAGHVDLSHHERAWQRLLKIRNIGPWTVEKLAFHGQGRDDRLPAGDLAYVKLVGHLLGLGRRATVPEVEEYFAPYAPFRGLAGAYALAGWHKAMGAGPPARLAA
jgi:3-methyladenine DNA glycosylase/8-oxoguanine DNA glycosylase